MTYKEQNRIILSTYIISIALNYLVTFVKSIPQTGAIANSIKITTLLTIWWLFYFYYGWKIPVLKAILFRMNFNGTWFGRYESITSSNEKISGDIAIRIKQNFLTISVISMTDKYENFSYSKTVKYDEKSNIHGISYTYSQKENNLFDTAQRNGTTELTLKNINKTQWLEGQFWTIHVSQGTINVKKISGDQMDTFQEAKNTAEANV